MIIINIITAVCLILLTAAVAYVLWSFISKTERKQRIEFVRSFKKGKCLTVLLIAMPLMCMGYVYNGQGILESIFSAIAHMVDLVVLKFGLDKVSDLIDDNIFYKITVYYCCVLVTINAILFTISLLSQNFWHFRKSTMFKLSKKDKLYVFGNNRDSLDIYFSNKSGAGVVIDNLDKEDCFKMYVDKVNYILSDNKSVVERIFKQLTKGRNKITVVINTNDDEKNLELCRLFSDIINLKDEKTQDILFDRLAIYFFCDPKYEAICENIVDTSCGCIHYKNKYQMIATNFIERYPFAKFMNSKQVDYEHALIKDGVNINVCMIGFGKTNRQIFLTSVANNQFLVNSDDNADGVQLKQAHYYIFDKEFAENDKNLNHSYYRYRNECLNNKNADKEKYLPLPQLPAKEDFFHLNINDADFYNNIRESLEKNCSKPEDKEKNANYVIIAYGTDLENIDMAHKLLEKRNEWGISNLIIFVKVRKASNYPKHFNEKDVIMIGNEKEDVYNLEEITNDAIYRMAKMRNAVYDLEYAVRHEDFVVNEESVKEKEKASNKKWFTKRSQIERDSNMYCCLSLKSKLNLIGLDYCRKDEKPNCAAMSEMEYLNYYAVGDMPDIETLKTQVNGKNIVNYSLDFPSSKRKNLAILEHYRWNSYMISKGIVPATKEQILNEDSHGKNYLLRRHGNLTTFEGLIEFRQLVAKKEGTDELTEDVIKYDYQLLDDAHWLLSQNGYKIIERVDK